MAHRHIRIVRVLADAPAITLEVMRLPVRGEEQGKETSHLYLGTRIVLNESLGEAGRDSISCSSESQQVASSSVRVQQTIDIASPIL